MAEICEENINEAKSPESPGLVIYNRYRRLSEELALLSREIMEALPDVAALYNPLEYADAPWREYLTRFCTGPRQIVFLGMNPGPWGMAQTGVPFGEIAAVRDWMGISAPVQQPRTPHPKRPIEGFSCTRSEVSGRRLWGLMQETYGTARECFQNLLVLNFCPLVFMAESGRNITPDKLPATYRTALEEACLRALTDSLQVLKPRYLVGVGAFATARLKGIPPRPEVQNPAPEVVQILHPSPASPAANRGWAEAVSAQLLAAGVWPPQRANPDRAEPQGDRISVSNSGK
ncbi:single-strand selective monofunctional uracil DNA glycosylase [Alkalispirochaeta americana]|uniref:Single-strand selective monofunctional uracil DNA glycosylase n=1 Tax=Alkalispirochaeta americana TaxID=159291 RepID=A0A1N6UEG3_9SPIO|nr:uracil-DNA glycosylase family protein [Alkalispirochaeta americana]SIQ63952.1 single-strand selective monofunctional uracil DNA glycosylase [Alkalispirochaeta americana]